MQFKECDQSILEGFQSTFRVLDLWADHISSCYPKDFWLTYFGTILMFWFVMLMSCVTLGRFVGNTAKLPVLQRTCEYSYHSLFLDNWNWLTCISDKQRHSGGHRPSVTTPYRPLVLLEAGGSGTRSLRSSRNTESKSDEFSSWHLTVLTTTLTINSKLCSIINWIM